ncbi:Putative methyltransferase [Polystyrenella longa]|uniref:Methyltransferase n=1 Tax=Polystyrenella longa TaxID=2528007 RepID=A0A518CQM7_9PLAN|nr:hypothetical protein [Polystyrenella longa]QDU81532.1 Putative methyltransferase [Polystyrenella longa]
MAEINNSDANGSDANSGVPGPFPVQGGWSRDHIEAGDRHFELTRPAEPDLLLDDPDVLRENETEVYVPYWALLWPASIRMTEIFRQGDWETGALCLEMGCGIGLVGLAALAEGLHVTFSDYRKEAVQLACWNAEQAGYQRDQSFTGITINWNDPPTDIQYEHIFGCEIVYETDFHEPILLALDRLLAPTGRCWFADSGRINSEKFFELAQANGWRVDRLDQQLQPHPAPQIGRFQIFCLAREAASVS